MDKIGKERLAWIDLAKFLGILFVLLAHAELNIPVIGGLAVYFYVPIFFVLSGYNYHKKEEPFSSFLKRKAKRLLLPYFTYNIFLYLFFFMKDFVITNQISIMALKPFIGILYSRNSLYPLDNYGNTYFLTNLNSPTWFLTALFVSVVLFEVGMRIVHFNEEKILIFSLVSAMIGIFLHYFCKILLPWSIDTAFLLEGLIAFGYWLKQKKILEEWKKYKILYFILTAAFLVSVKWNGKINISVDEFGKTVFLGMFHAAVSSAIVMWICYLLRDHIVLGLKLIGQSSLCIMSLHLFVFMFIKTGFNLMSNGIMEGNTIAATMCKAFMVCITLSILTIADIWYLNLRRRTHAGA